MPRPIEELLDGAWRDLDNGNLLGARSKARRAFNDERYKAEALHILGIVSLEDGDPRFALNLFRRARALEGDWADLVYDTALAHERLGDTKEMIAAFIKVLELDALELLPLPLSEDDLVAAAEEILEQLPREMRDPLKSVPILVEDRPDLSLVESGFDPRALGVFDGVPWSEQGLTGPTLSRIVLYTANIGARCATRQEALEQVEITLLHETAHYFGLDEEQVARLGLA